MDIEAFIRREKMLKLREELLAVEEDRLAGRSMDINLSKTIKANTLLFCRYVSFPFFNCTSGIGFTFSEGLDKDLLDKYRQLQIKIKADNDAMRRFGAFFRLNRIYGNEIRFMDAGNIAS